MARTKRWRHIKFENGVGEYKLSSWKYFSDYINQELLDFTNYVFRGQGNSAWKLEPTLDRIIKKPNSPKRIEHLEKFKYETRGRRGPNPSVIDYENDWWALGQHHGLDTPLLDWTESPFVALYFAAISALEKKTKDLAVFAFHQYSAEDLSIKIKEDTNIKKINNRAPTLKVIKPLSDENNRLVSQRGLFTRGPNNMDLETWVKRFNPPEDTGMALIKLVIPNTSISDCLRYLNRMNINHSTLFPDLTGASEFCNTHLRITKY